MKPIDWKAGKYYIDNCFGMWCCVDVSNAHGLQCYRLIRVRYPNGEHVKPGRVDEVEWFYPNGRLVSSARTSLQIVGGPKDHPEPAAWLECNPQLPQGELPHIKESGEHKG